METPIEKRQREEKKISFSDRWEEELKQQLFNETDVVKEENIEEVLSAKTSIHKERPGEE